jgi:hypothetical protein
MWVISPFTLPGTPFGEKRQISQATGLTAISVALRLWVPPAETNFTYSIATLRGLGEILRVPGVLSDRPPFGRPAISSLTAKRTVTPSYGSRFRYLLFSIFLEVI